MVPGKYAPVPEFAIPLFDFSLSYIQIMDDVDSFKENMKASSYQKYLASLLPEYMANFERGYFMEGYDIYSVLETDKPYVLKKKN